MPFGLTNAPSTFMRLINEVLKEFIGKCVIVYLDDILIYNKTRGDHLGHIKMVLSTLQKNKLLINLKKCSFVKDEMIYLGFVISKYGLKIYPNKFQAIMNWITPRNVFEVRSFHGLSSFYRKFIISFNQLCAPIVETNKERKQPFKWTKEVDRNFKVLKKKIIKQLVLALPDFGKFFQVETDASGTTIGVVLSKDQRIIAYLSEKLNEAKQKYSSYDKEFYAIVQALKKCKHYPMPKEFVLYTDNNALQFISSQPKMNQRHAKWVQFLQNFTFVIKHTGGKENKVVDELSRINLILQEFQVNTLGFDGLKDMYKEDVDFRDAYVAYENTVSNNRIQWLNYMIQQGFLLKDSKLCIARCSMRENLIKEKHSGGLSGHWTRQDLSLV
jgi:ribonuclease HI